MKVLQGLYLLLNAAISTGFLPVLLTIAAGLLLLGFIIWRWL